MHQLAWVIFASIICPSHLVAAAKPERPNIVFMLADDQGWNGLSVAMPDGAEPHLGYQK